MLIDPEEHEVDALVRRLVPAPRRVIEIGCGDGRVTRRYCGRVGTVIAIDPDADAVAAFRASGLPANVDARATAVEQLALPDGAADAVIFSWAL
jgi:16S rRNA A1518/A1519 N6-dimethyltransferase RsmA/KsgA/DIM1 with predicted DNA glycosylase/AP lyase activity